MMFKWKLLVLIIWCGVIGASYQSIAGVTYMDDFDFEDRYRNVVECDPMYWHPLHLPDHCAKMYEQLIRSRIAKHYPVRVMTENNANIMFHLYPNKEEAPDNEPSSHHSKPRHHHHKSHSGSDHRSPTMVYRPDFRNSWLTPYEQMLDLLRADVMNNPSGARIEIIPNLGPVALYRQPISRKSEKAIKKVAGAYKIPKNAVASGAGVDDDYEIIANKDGKNLLKKKEKLVAGGNGEKKNKRRKNIQRKKIVKDNMIAIFENKRIT